MKNISEKFLPIEVDIFKVVYSLFAEMSIINIFLKTSFRSLVIIFLINRMKSWHLSMVYRVYTKTGEKTHAK